MKGGKGGWEDEGGREVLFFSCAPSSLLFFARAPSLSPLLGPARYGAHGSAPCTLAPMSHLFHGCPRLLRVLITCARVNLSKSEGGREEGGEEETKTVNFF